MNIQLVVVQAFGPHAKGDCITDPAQIQTILAGGNAGRVVRVTLPTAQPAASAAKEL
jgi:hypothetical protein